MVEPLIVASVVRSSWPTMPRNSARSRSSSSRGVMSWMVTTTDTASFSPEYTGLALASVVIERPSFRWVTTSSACTVSPVHSARVWGSSSGGISQSTARPRCHSSSIVAVEDKGRAGFPAL